MYFTLIMAFAILALIIAVPLGGQGAYALSLFIGDEIEFQPSSATGLCRVLLRSRFWSVC